MTAFKRFDVTAFFDELEIDPAATAASAANTPPARQFAAVAASAARGKSKTEMWVDTDWHDYYEERASILEFDAKQSRSEAERQAFEATVIQWMNLNPPSDLDDDHCDHCGEPVGRIGQDAVPVLIGVGRHAWLHHGCHAPWMAITRQKAIKALSAIGINPEIET